LETVGVNPRRGEPDDHVQPSPPVPARSLYQPAKKPRRPSEPTEGRGSDQGTPQRDLIGETLPGRRATSLRPTGRPRASTRATPRATESPLYRSSVSGLGSSCVRSTLAVLRSARRPLTTREIVETAIRRGLIEPSGKTPEATLSAVLYRRVSQDPQLVKLANLGRGRAERGTVRWALRSKGASGKV
jgi:hypothetical protein